MKMRWIAGAVLLLLAAGACARSATDSDARDPAGARPAWTLEEDISNIPDEMADTISDGGGGGGYFGSGLRGESNDSTAKN